MTKPSQVGHINWEPNLSFDPTSLDPFATHGIPIPTYGNYGGPGYTAGTLGGTTPPPPPNPPPVDALDELFYAHDFALQQANGNPQVIVAASIDLVLKMDALPLINPSDPSYDPAAQLYEGLGTLAVVSQLIAPAWKSIDQPTQALIETAAQHAVTNFEEGLATIPGEAGSLHGAFHVFEQKFAQLLPFDLLMPTSLGGNHEVGGEAGGPAGFPELPQAAALLAQFGAAGFQSGTNNGGPVGAPPSQAHSTEDTLFLTTPHS
jgi:hypothetical protein